MGWDLLPHSLPLSPSLLLFPLQVALEDREAQRSAEETRAKRFEKELLALRSKLERASQEVVASNARASSLRTEGRRARTHVLEAVSHMWEIVHIAQADAKAAGIDILSSAGID